MSALYERLRPSRLVDVVGQTSTIESLRALLARNFNGGVFYLIGPSGSGKTTIAKALVNELDIDSGDVTEIGGADVSIDFVREQIYNFSLSTWGESGWKALIVNESQAMLPRTVQALLPWLEALPKKRLVIFTSTEPLEADMFGNFTGPLASRCKVHTLEPDLEAFAAHVAQIATNENLNGQPIEAYRALIASCACNMRAALQRVESGEMLKPHKPSAHAVQSVQSVQAVQQNWPKQASSGALVLLERQIADEIQFGKKFFTGSKKHGMHVERLAALEKERKALMPKSPRTVVTPADRTGFGGAA